MAQLDVVIAQLDVALAQPDIAFAQLNIALAQPDVVSELIELPHGKTINCSGSEIFNE